MSPIIPQPPTYDEFAAERARAERLTGITLDDLMAAHGQLRAPMVPADLDELTALRAFAAAALRAHHYADDWEHEIELARAGLLASGHADTPTDGDDRARHFYYRTEIGQRLLEALRVLDATPGGTP